MNPPILYSFRRCPYAMRARMALLCAGITVELREVDLKNKPSELIDASLKGTVPVLVVNDCTILDESRDIMNWALQANDPEEWQARDLTEQHKINTLIDKNDQEFARQLTHYKYADRYPEHSEQTYRQLAEDFVQNLESKLEKNAFLMGERCTLADIALMPFIRQFANVDSAWFETAPYPKLRAWLDHFLQSERFEKIMVKVSPWNSGTAQETVYL